MAYTLYESDFTQRTNAVVDRFTGVEGPLLPILHGLQEEFGHVPESSLRVVADRLNLSRAEVHGVATFYHDFRTAPAGRHTLKICRAEACQAMGSDRLAERAASTLRIDFGATAPDGSVTLEAVYCLGLCALSPAAMIDGRVVGRVDDEKLDSLIREARS